MKGDTVGKKLFAVTLATRFDNNKFTIWTEIWRGGSVNGVKKEATDALKTSQAEMDKMIGGTTVVEHVTEIGSLR